MQTKYTFTGLSCDVGYVVLPIKSVIEIYTKQFKASDPLDRGIVDLD
jgi:hypothetical protein